MIDCATQRVTTSASVNLLLAFFFLTGRRSSAVQKTAVSSRSRSASIVALLRVDGADRHRRLRPRCSLPLPRLPGRRIRGTTHLGGLWDRSLGVLSPAAGEGESPAVRGDQAAD